MIELNSFNKRLESNSEAMLQVEGKLGGEKVIC